MVVLVPTTVAKGFASHDANSFKGRVATTMRGVDAKFKTPTLRAKERGTEGRTRGVGRHMDRDPNSLRGPVKTVMRARSEQGKFTSSDSALKVFHPIGRKNKSRPTKPMNNVMRYQSNSASIGHGVKKSLDLPGSGRRGKRLA